MKTWFHIDMDAFYASIEQLDFPQYRGKPLIVGGPKGSRGVVSTCSYEARAFGVHAAMSNFEAERLCPDGIFVPPRMKRYFELSQAIMAIFRDFAPEVLQVSVDEAYLDFSGTQRLLGPPEHIAGLIKARVHKEIGLTLSIGIGTNKFIAKMCSGYKKPNGLTRVLPGDEESFVSSLQLKKLWGVGEKGVQRLQRFGIYTVNQLKSYELADLERQFGSHFANYLWKVSRGIDPGIYEDEVESHSISREFTFSEDVSDSPQIEQVLFELVESCVYRLKEQGFESDTARIKLRNSNFETFSMQKKSSESIRSIEKAFEIAKQLLLEKWDKKSPLRLIGFGFMQASEKPLRQIELFSEENAFKEKALDAVIELKKKFGKNAPVKARSLAGKTDRDESIAKAKRPE